MNNLCFLHTFFAQFLVQHFHDDDVLKRHLYFHPEVLEVLIVTPLQYF